MMNQIPLKEKQRTLRGNENKLKEKRRERNGRLKERRRKRNVKLKENAKLLKESRSVRNGRANKNRFPLILGMIATISKPSCTEFWYSWFCA